MRAKISPNPFTHLFFFNSLLKSNYQQVSFTGLVKKCVHRLPCP